MQSVSFSQLPFYSIAIHGIFKISLGDALHPLVDTLGYSPHIELKGGIFIDLPCSNMCLIIFLDFSFSLL